MNSACRLPSEPFAGLLSSTLAMERDLTAGLPSLISETRDSELRRRLEKHLAETREHEGKVRKMFEAFGAEPAPADRNPALSGLTEMHRERVARTPQELHDIAVAASAAASEHLEISLYEALRTMADAIDSRDVVVLIDEILAEERQALDAATMAVHRLSRSHTGAMAPSAET